MPQEPVAREKGKALRAAKRSLGLVKDAVNDHVAAYADKTVPDDSFLASAIRYEQARSNLLLLDALSDDTQPDEPEEVTDQHRADLGVLVELLHDLVPELETTGSSPLARMVQVAFPDGAVPWKQEVKQ